MCYGRHPPGATAETVAVFSPDIEELILSDTLTTDEVIADAATELESQADEYLDEPSESAEALQGNDLKLQHLEEIEELETLASEAEEEFDIASAHAKALKKRWEGKVEVLRSVIRRGVNPQQQLPFGDDEEDPGEAWKIVAIDEVLELTDKQAETLNEAGVLTIEHFENLRAGDGLASLTGIGQTTADKWEGQMLDWLAQNAREAESGEQKTEVDDDAKNSQDGDEPSDEG